MDLRVTLGCLSEPFPVALLDRLDANDPADERAGRAELGAIHVHQYCRTGKPAVLRLWARDDERT